MGFCQLGCLPQSATVVVSMAGISKPLQYIQNFPRHSTFVIDMILVVSEPLQYKENFFYTSIVCTPCLSIISAMAKKLLHRHSVYNRFLLYLLFCRCECDGEVIAYHHSINSSVDALSQVLGQSNYVQPQYILDMSLLQKVCCRFKGEVITYLHSIYLLTKTIKLTQL